MCILRYKEEGFEIKDKCFEIHNNSGLGFQEIVYKDALEYEFNKTDILYESEKELFLNVNYKN